MVKVKTAFGWCVCRYGDAMPPGDASEARLPGQMEEDTKVDGHESSTSSGQSSTTTAST